MIVSKPFFLLNGSKLIEDTTMKIAQIRKCINMYSIISSIMLNCLIRSICSKILPNIVKKIS